MKLTICLIIIHTTLWPVSKIDTLFKTVIVNFYMTYKYDLESLTFGTS